MSDNQGEFQVTYDPDVMGHVEESWRSTLDGKGSVYADPLWYQVWWDAFGKEGQFLFLEGQGQGDLYLPMVLNYRTLGLAGNLYSHRHGFASSWDDEELVTRLVSFWESGTHWDQVLLKNLPKSLSAVRALETFVKGRNGWSSCLGETEHWAIPEEEWWYHLDKQGRDSRKKRRRVHRRLEEHGNFRFQRYQTVEEAKAFARIYFRVMVRSWKKPDSSRNFFRRLCQRFAEIGWFRSYVLFIDGEPAGFQLGFYRDGVYSCYKTAYDPAFSKLSPGIAVMDYAFDDVFLYGASAVDLLTGEGSYKSIWCNQTVEQVTLSYRPS